MTQSNSDTIRSIYGAFGRGDVAAIVESFIPEGEISFNVARTVAPWQRSIKGQPQLPSFFTAVAENVEFSAFEPLDFVEGADAVIVRVHMKYRVKASGRTVDQMQVHWWTFAGSRIRSLVHYEDTAQVAAALG